LADLRTSPWGLKADQLYLQLQRVPRPGEPSSCCEREGIMADISVQASTGTNVLLRTLDVRQILRREVLGKRKASGMKSNKLILS
jgi:hypothetical protein